MAASSIPVVVDGGLRFPQPGWDEARMEEKFRWAAGFVLDQSRIDALAEMLWRFALTAKVEVVEDPEMERLCRLFEQGDPSGRFASTVTITLRDGRRSLPAGGRRAALPPAGLGRGAHGREVSLDDGLVRPEERRAALGKLLWCFETVPSVRELIAAIA